MSLVEANARCACEYFSAGVHRANKGGRRDKSPSTGKYHAATATEQSGVSRARGHAHASARSRRITNARMRVVLNGVPVRSRDRRWPLLNFSELMQRPLDRSDERGI